MKAIKLFLLIIISFAINISVQAQWHPLSGIYGGRVDYFCRNTNYIFAASWGNGVFRSSDNGSTWEEVNTGITSYYVNAISASDQVLLVGTGSGLFRSTDDGASWNNVNNGLSSTSDVISISILNNNLAFLGIELGGIYKSTNNGISWSYFNTGILSGEEACSFVSVGDTIITSTTSGHLYKSLSNASNWTQLSQALALVMTKSGNNLYARGYNNSMVYISTNNGTSWQNISGTLSNYEIFRVYVDGIKIYASTNNGLFLSTDNGTFWNLIYNTTTFTYWTYGLIAFDSTILISSYGDILRSINNGVDWNTSNQGYSAVSIHKIKYFNSTIFLATDHGIFASTNNGITWVAKNNGLTDLGVSAMAIKGTRLFAGTWGGSVFTSTNNGTTWVSVSNGLPQLNEITALVVCGIKVFAAVYANGLWVSNNNGATWTQVLTAYCNTIAVNGTKVYVGTDGDGFLYSSNSGISWSTLGTLNEWIKDIALTNNYIFAGSDFNGIFRSTDNGTNWEQLTNGLGLTSALTSVSAVGSNIFTGGGYGASLFMSPDYGQTWTQEIQGMFSPYNITDIEVIGTNVFAASYFRNKLFKRPLTDFNISVNNITGRVYNDVNSNHMLDSLETGFQDLLLYTMPSNIYTSSNITGDYEIFSYMNTDTLKVIPPNAYSQVYPAYYIINQSDSNKNFGIIFTPNVKDLQITLTNLTPARPGFNNILRITFKNNGTVTMNGTIKLAFDNSLNYISSNPSQSFINGDTLVWNFSNLSMFESSDIDITFNIPSSVSIGSVLVSTAYIYPILGDTLPGNNINGIKQIVTGSFDPNEKEVEPSDGISPSQISNGDKLIYTIHFQNTGTDTAFTIIVLDTLDANIFIPSFEVLSASHSYSYTIRDHGIIEFTFNNILLPDSITNETYSHGFVKYSVRPKTSLQLGDEIHNTANIYFDYNLPIATNTTNTPVQLPLIITKNSGDNGTILIYPNPAKERLTIESYFVDRKSKIEIMNTLGEILFTSSFYKKLDVNISTFVDGIYLIKISSSNNNYISRFIKQ